MYIVLGRKINLKEIKMIELEKRLSLGIVTLAFMLLITSQAQGEQVNSQMKALSISDQINKLLHHVTRSEIVQVEKILKENPGLALEKGTITDLSDRTFEHITPFQYAIWALDWHMWSMLKEHLDKLDSKEARLQLKEWEEKETFQHGKHFNIQKLFAAYDKYLKNFDGWLKDKNWSALENCWIKVGAVQRLLPAHILVEYTTPDRPLSDLQEADFEKNKAPKQHEQFGLEWIFTQQYHGGGIGEEWALWRGPRDRAHGYIDRKLVTRGFTPNSKTSFANVDYKAIRKLWKTRIEQLDELRLSYKNSDVVDNAH